MRGRHLCILVAFSALVAGSARADAGDPPVSTKLEPTRVAPDPVIPLGPRATAPDNYLQSFGNGMVTFGQNVFQDLNVQFHSPFRYARHQPLKFAGGALGLAALIGTDQYTHPMMTEWVGDTARRRAQKLSDFGRAPTSLYLIGGVGVLGLISGSSREQESSVMLIESVVTSSVWTHSLKALAGRERPRETDANVAEWEGPHLLGDREEPYKSLRSFPSGHTTGAFATATILAHRYPTKGIVPVLAYTGAAAMGYSRMIVGAHWLSDVVVGALIGYGSARTVISNHEQRAAAVDPSPSLQWGLELSPGYQGIAMEYDF